MMASMSAKMFQMCLNYFQFMGRLMSRVSMFCQQESHFATGTCVTQSAAALSLLHYLRLFLNVFQLIYMPLHGKHLSRCLGEKGFPLCTSCTQSLDYHSTQPQQPHSIYRHTSLTRARQTTAQRNKGIERRKRGTTLGISNSSSKALS